MSKLTVPILGLILFLWIAGWTWYFAQNYCDQNASAAISTAPGLNLSDGDFSAKTTENFSFGWSNDSPNISNNSSNLLKSLAGHLNANPDRQVTLTGLFASNENNTTSYNNLGIARAEAIRTKLKEMGADAENIVTDGFRMDNSLFKNEKMEGGIYFTFDEKVETPLEEEIPVETAEPIGETVEAKPVSTASYYTPKTVFYKTGQFDLNYYDQKLINYLNDLLKYLKRNRNRKVIITGHTDNVGDEEVNQKISEARAMKIRRYLVDAGTRRNQIEVNYHADDTPTAPNDSEEGRAKNRRVEMVIK